MANPSPLSRAITGMSGTRRFLLLGALAALIVGVWLVSRWAGAPTYVALYRDLDLGEAATISDKLAKSDITYRLAAGGSAVEVAADDIARARVALAKDGLPSLGRPGLELFDKPSWGMTDFTQRITYQRALEGELARTIGGLRGIARAQVHLVIPTPTALHRDERPASASIVLSLKPGVALASDAVQGITYIVSNSVEQLSSENVAVMDDAGHVLSVPASGGPAGLTTRQIELQRSVEQHLGEQVEELLATVVGAGHARAKVSAQLSFDQVDRTVDTYDPEGQVIENEQKSESGGEGAASGTQTIVNNAYQNSRRLEKIIGSVGGITRLTVAVLVDEKSLTPGSVTTEKIDAMVRDAVGADSARGDRVSVAAVPFEAAAAPTPGAGTEAPHTDPIVVVERISRPLVGLVAIVALLLLSWRLIATLAVSRPAGEPAAITEEPVTNGANGAATPRNRIRADAHEKPEATAQVVRAWLAES